MKYPDVGMDVVELLVDSGADLYVLKIEVRLLIDGCSSPKRQKQKLPRMKMRRTGVWRVGLKDPVIGVLRTARRLLA
jgi:hypothetical protein